MASAQIAQGFDTDGNCISLTMTVTGDVLDSGEIIEECVTRAALLWHVTQAEDEDS